MVEANVDLQCLGNLERYEGVVRLPSCQAWLADDCECKQWVVLCSLLSNISR